MSDSRSDDERAVRAAYARKRYHAIRAGTWEPRRSSDPSRTPTEIDVAWAAGFLEGEGAFGTAANDATVRVRADQVNREPLARLFELFGGGLSTRGTPTTVGNTVWRWYTGGARAREVMRQVRPHMSDHKKAQIDNALARVEARPRGFNNAAKTHCPKGHPYDEANTHLTTNSLGGKQRLCRECRRTWLREHRRRQRAKLK